MYFWKFWNCPNEVRAISKFSKMHEGRFIPKLPDPNMWFLVNHTIKTLKFSIRFVKQRTVFLKHLFTFLYSTSTIFKSTHCFLECLRSLVEQIVCCLHSPLIFCYEINIPKIECFENIRILFFESLKPSLHLRCFKVFKQKQIKQDLAFLESSAKNRYFTT